MSDDPQGKSRRSLWRFVRIGVVVLIVLFCTLVYAPAAYERIVPWSDLSGPKVVVYLDGAVPDDARVGWQFKPAEGIRTAILKENVFGTRAAVFRLFGWDDGEPWSNDLEWEVPVRVLVESSTGSWEATAPMSAGNELELTLGPAGAANLVRTSAARYEMN